MPPDDPREWLARARSDLIIAKAQLPGVRIEDLCYHAQQAAEKAIKAVLLKQAGCFPYIHDLAELLNQVQQTGIEVSDPILDVAELTPYAVEGRYPGFDDLLEREDQERATGMASKVIAWAESIIIPPEVGLGKRET